jgi:hypothetical protein
MVALSIRKNGNRLEKSDIVIRKSDILKYIPFLSYIFSFIKNLCISSISFTGHFYAFVCN